MKRINIFKIILYIVLMVSAIILSFGIQIIKFNFDMSIFRDPKVWLSAVLNAYLFFTISLSALLFTYDFLQNDPKYKNVEEEIYKKTPGLMNAKFENRIDRHNWDKKKKVWFNKLSIKLTNHRKKRSRKIYEEIRTKEPIDYSFKTRRWVNKLKHLSEQKTVEWINRNLLFTKLNYEEITVNEILYGMEKPKTKKRELVSPLRGNIFIKFINPVISTTITVLLNALIFDKEGSGTVKIISIVGVMLIAIVLNVATSIFGGISSHKRRLYNTNVRFNKIKAYIDGEYETLEELPGLWEYDELNDLIIRKESPREEDKINDKEQVIIQDIENNDEEIIEKEGD